MFVGIPRLAKNVLSLRPNMIPTLLIRIRGIALALFSATVSIALWIVYILHSVPWLFGVLERQVIITWRMLMAILHWLAQPDQNQESTPPSLSASCHRFNRYRKSYRLHTISNHGCSLSKIAFVFHLGAGWCLQFCSGTTD